MEIAQAVVPRREARDVAIHLTRLAPIGFKVRGYALVSAGSYPRIDTLSNTRIASLGSPAILAIRRASSLPIPLVNNRQAVS